MKKWKTGTGRQFAHSENNSFDFYAYESIRCVPTCACRLLYINNNKKSDSSLWQISVPSEGSWFHFPPQVLHEAFYHKKMFFFCLRINENECEEKKCVLFLEMNPFR